MQGPVIIPLISTLGLSFLAILLAYKISFSVIGFINSTLPTTLFPSKPYMLFVKISTISPLTCPSLIILTPALTWSLTALSMAYLYSSYKPNTFFTLSKNVSSFLTTG
uniref:Putative antitoxin VapB5 n=1 Tax=Methanocaldococcus jannaschii (strain ATCC 43067 / DSM 2661 / JAL-1 / JCM 10045 / NBRC 100440) TaxID=243232 RepID=VAPB5_METJA|nr:RecName: Full=Putative antitoxin VapB5 [Methanocaldococcus jannaschii DSM 2661]